MLLEVNYRAKGNQRGLKHNLKKLIKIKTLNILLKRPRFQDLMKILKQFQIKRVYLLVVQRVLYL